MARRTTLAAVPEEPARKSYRRHVPSQKINHLTASGQLVGRPGDPSVPPPAHASHMWQHDALNYADAVGELKYAMRWYGNCGSRIRLVPGLMDDYGSVITSFDDAETEPPDELDEAAEYVSALQSNLGGQAELMRAGFENMFLTGEAYLVGYDGAQGEAWEVLGISELRPVGTATKTRGQRFERIYGPGLTPEQIPPDAFVARLWNPHRRFTRLADSSVHGALDILEELVLLTQAVKASAVSRLRGAGILWVPSEIIVAFNEGAEEGSDDDDPFTTELVEAMVTPIGDAASASRVAPMVVDAAAEFIDKVKYMSFGELDRVQQVVERREALERLSIQLDMPVEVLLGHQQTTFANAAQITEDGFRVHIEPTAVQWCGGLTGTYLAARFRAAHGIADDETLPDVYRRIAVGYDASKLVSKPDRSKETIEILRLAPWLLSGAASRRSVGFEESDAPADDEVVRIINQVQQLNTRATIRINEGDSTSTAAVEKAMIADPDRFLDDPSLQKESAAAAPTVRPGEAPPPPSPPAEEPPTVKASGAPGPDVFALQAAAVAEFAVERAVERAGVKLRGKSRGTVKSALDGVANEAVARTLGPAATAKLAGEDDPFFGELAALTASVVRLADAAGMGHPGSVAAKVTALAEDAARARLFDGSSTVTPDQVCAALRTT